MGCLRLTERDFFKLHNCNKKTAYSRFFCTATDDTFGNRTTYDTTESGSNVQSVYTANNLNQYTAITNPSHPSQSPTYDPDGNMLSMTLNSGSWTNTYNAENRIIAQEKSDVRIEFTYDYAGCRVEKKVYSGSTGNWTLDKHLKFVYDNFEQIEELDALNNNVVTKKRTWSIIFWGTGTLLSEIQGVNTYYSVGDSNKNITEYLDSSGAIQAHYEYSPFGKITVSSGFMKDDFDYRFSSEVFDQETGLVYYNYRYYSPELGRWLKRDPIEENGGWNIYGMIGNNSVNWCDYFGLLAGDDVLHKNNTWIFVKWDDCKTDSWWVVNISELATTLTEKSNGRKICYLEIEGHGWSVGADNRKKLKEKGFIDKLAKALKDHVTDTSTTYLDGCSTGGDDKADEDSEAGKLSGQLPGKYTGNVGTVGWGNKMTGPLVSVRGGTPLNPRGLKDKQTFEKGKLKKGKK